ncbi:MAG: helix-turn-helix transcriptional regulator [Promethearchaeota archaeon]
MRNNLRALRERKGLTQQQLAELVGVTRETISIVERGRYNPSLPLAFKLARVLEVSVEDLWELEESDWPA